MNKTTRVNNVVPKKTIRAIQQDVLDTLSEILKQSFGPMGSNTIIKKENALNVYTKDGHTILKNVYFHGIIEQSIKDDIESITRHIVTTVGDGTTSAVMLSKDMFKAISEIGDANMIPPAEILHRFKQAVNNIIQRIDDQKKICNVDDIYDICMISTNGNEALSKMIADIYYEHGMEVFIDVLASTDERTYIKSYDGMTLNTGFGDSCYVTDNQTNEAVVDHPSIYFFKDPIDTKEMAVMFDAILSKNIVGPYNTMAMAASGENRGVAIEPMIPTVIVAPKISRDLSSLMSKITDLMAHQSVGQKLPLLIITDYHQRDEVEDICLLTGAPSIKKYIDPEIMKEDIEKGLAPTPETIQDFCGHCDQVVASSFRTSFINPCKMKDENGEYSSTFNNLLSFLQTELSRAREDGEDARFVGTLKRRIHSLKSNLVELSVGGISPSDRDATRDLVEDAVLNCRSAARDGVGFAANFMGLKSSFDYLVDILGNNPPEDASPEEQANYKIDLEIASMIHGAYGNITRDLYSTVISNTDKVNAIVADSIEKGYPMNIRTKDFDPCVKSSIESDIIVLSTVNELIGLMATSNQFIVPSPMHNVYVDYLEEEK